MMTPAIAITAKPNNTQIMNAFRVYSFHLWLNIARGGIWANLNTKCYKSRFGRINDH